METTRMHGKRQYTLIVRGRVQSEGFRGYVEDACERLGIGGIDYTVGTEELRVLCDADLETVKELSNLLRAYQFAEIKELQIKDRMLLPDVFMTAYRY
jgi:acylphosphatase